jgi:hypothetical protein
MSAELDPNEKKYSLNDLMVATREVRHSAQGLFNFINKIGDENARLRYEIDVLKGELYDLRKASQVSGEEKTKDSM